MIRAPAAGARPRRRGRPPHPPRAAAGVHHIPHPAFGFRPRTGIGKASRWEEETAPRGRARTPPGCRCRGGRRNPAPPRGQARAPPGRGERRWRRWRRGKSPSAVPVRHGDQGGARRRRHASPALSPPHPLPAPLPRRRARRPRPNRPTSRCRDQERSDAPAVAGCQGSPAHRQGGARASAAPSRRGGASSRCSATKSGCSSARSTARSRSGHSGWSDPASWSRQARWDSSSTLMRADLPLLEGEAKHPLSSLKATRAWPVSCT